MWVLWWWTYPALTEHFFEDKLPRDQIAEAEGEKLARHLLQKLPLKIDEALLN
jgi:hypothetical protein